MFTRVVVGTDGSATADKAVEVAAGLAREWGAQLHVVTAFRATGPGMGSAAGADLLGSGSEGIQHEAAEHVGKRAADEWGKGIDTQVHVVAESAADAILEVAGSVGADLIVVGSVGMRGARRVLGSIPNSVAHGANCAVLVVKTD